MPELSNSFMIHPMFKKKKYGQPQVRTRSLSLSEMVGEMTMNELDNQSDFGNSEDECVTDSEREVVVDESIEPMVGEVNLSPTTIEVVVDKLIEPTVGEVNLSPTTIEVAVDKLIEPTVGEVNLRPDFGGANVVTQDVESTKDSLKTNTIPLPQTPTGMKRPLSPNDNTPVGRLSKMSTEMGASPELNRWRLEEVEYWQETGGEEDVFTRDSRQENLLGINRIHREVQTPRRRLGSHGVFDWMMNNNRPMTPVSRSRSLSRVKKTTESPKNQPLMSVFLKKKDE